MRVAGIIAEYNPFHNGHICHLQAVRRITQADAVVAVMSGDYVQRGEPAVTDKYRRARMALEAGVDLVLELPVCWATGSAERFAFGAVRMLTQLGPVTDLVYGCEAGSQVPLRQIAAVLAREPEDYRKLLQAGLKDGLGFPAAREQALKEMQLLPQDSGLLRAPNNILGLEYEKALLRLNSPIQSHGIPRVGTGHHATGTAIRQALQRQDTDTLKKLLPPASLALLEQPMFFEDLLPLIRYRITVSRKEDLAQYLDVGPELAARILQAEGDIERITDRNHTRTRVCRALLHILLEIRVEQMPPYLRVLGFRKDSPILKWCKEAENAYAGPDTADTSDAGEPLTPLPCLTRLSRAPEHSWDMDALASRIYQQAVSHKYGTAPIREYAAGPVII